MVVILNNKAAHIFRKFTRTNGILNFIILSSKSPSDCYLKPFRDQKKSLSG